MHPRNPYQTPPDFKELALKFPEFRKFAKQKLTGKIEIDFKDAAAVRALTTALLKKDFNLEVELPPDRLVPTLPLRLNYLLWIEDLLKLEEQPSEQTVHGIDIGTGACCIYPILAARKNDWHFTATEADELNFESSQRTVEKNNLQKNITLVKVTPQSHLIGNIDTSLVYNFTMCNPPFFDSEDPVPKSRSDKRTPPTCPKSGGSTSLTEIAVKGGEVQFLKNLILECQELKSCIRIFTTMVGHKSSLLPIVTILKEAGASSWCDTEFCQGRTRRWGIAWTFDDNIKLRKLPEATKTGKAITPPPLKYLITLEKWGDKSEFSLSAVMVKIVEQLTILKMDIKKLNKNKSSHSLEFVAKENTWSNQRRKRREENRIASSEPEQKKAKLEHEATKSVQEQPTFYLKGLLLLEETSSAESITLHIQCIEGGLGRESINQILQYMKNHLFDK